MSATILRFPGLPLEARYQAPPTPKPYTPPARRPRRQHAAKDMFGTVFARLVELSGLTPAQFADAMNERLDRSRIRELDVECWMGGSSPPVANYLIAAMWVAGPCALEAFTAVVLADAAR